MSIIFKGSNDQSLFPIPKTSYLERNYSKTFRKTGNTTSNRNDYKVPYLSNIFPDNEVEGGEQPRWTVKSNEFIQWLTDLRASLKHGLKIIRCLCKLLFKWPMRMAKSFFLYFCFWPSSGNRI